ncbi:Aminopeptidase RNPEPL1 [Bagarius yarrelli]|uniref:Aminopeptidase RNPEPL1 n=1 Tax=Bagarius yarrelli TaxID=175774 RepID=A0A556VBK0_BAGYA|nr:Aminopeptidase RNPEPL1 [Bagarius yarrelli]
MAELNAALCCCCRKALPVSGKARDGARSLGRCRLVDVASASNFHSFSLRHFHLDLRVNFGLKRITGWQALELVTLQPGVQTLVLDIHPSLLIHSVDCKVPGTPGSPDIILSLSYNLEPFTDYGSSLRIALPTAAIRPHRPFRVTIRYTATDGPAIWWLDTELTCGKTRPLVFTQGHSVCNRSFFPCFDTPAVKSTYSATIWPDAFNSAGNGLRPNSNQSNGEIEVFRSGLISKSRTFSRNRCVHMIMTSRVWAEPCLLTSAVSKLGGSVERCLDVAEQLFGPYVWGRYDIVFLPPSFPIVAMENPCLTFIISSILESQEFLLIDVIHEIAHGWFGNAVTNATWEEMWLTLTCLETVFRLDALHRQMRLLGDNNPVSKLQAKFEPGLEFERWLNECGPPLCEPDLSAGVTLTGPVQHLCELWSMDSPDRQAIASFDLSMWSTFQTVLFLDRLLDRSPLPQEVMSLLSSCYSVLLDDMNAEVQIRWLQVVVRNGFYPDLHRVRCFLQKHTSRMYTVPLYEDLCGGVLKCFAIEVFYQTQDRLHPNLRKALQQILFQTSAANTSSSPALVGPTPSAPAQTPDPPTNGTMTLLDVNVSA